MITAFALVLTSLALAGLGIAASRDRHTSAVDGDLFRYPAVMKWILFAAIPGGTFLAASLLKQIYPDGPKTSLDWAFFGVFALIFLCLAFTFFYTKSYFICVKREEILIHEITGERRIRFSDVMRLDIVQGAKSEELSLFGERGKKLVNVGATIQDFSSLATLLKQRIQEFGGTVRHRDRMGKWS